MASVFQREQKGKWFYSWVDADGNRHCRTGAKSKRQTERLAQKVQDEVDREKLGLVDPDEKRFGDHEKRPIAEHIADFLESMRAARRATRYVKVREGQLRDLVEGVNAQRLSHLTPDAVEGHLNSLRKKPGRYNEALGLGLSAATINGHRAAAVSFLTWCVQRGRISRNPLTCLRTLNVQKDRRRQRRDLTMDEIDRLLAATDTPDRRYRRIVYLVALLAGLRRSELELLTWGDVDFEAGVIFVPATIGKSGRDDMVPMNDQLRASLAGEKPQGAKPTDRVFRSIPQIRTVYRDFERAGIPVQDDAGRWVDLHATRATCVTMLLRAGVNPTLVQKFARHAKLTTTMQHYSKLGISDAAEAAAALPEFGGPAQSGDRARGGSAARTA